MLRNFLGKPRDMSLIICTHPNEQVFQGGDKENICTFWLLLEIKSSDKSAKIMSQQKNRVNQMPGYASK